MMRNLVLGEEDGTLRQFSKDTAPLFATRLDASKKLVELSDAELLKVAGGAGMCSNCPELH